jgi:hypothetical protein
LIIFLTLTRLVVVIIFENFSFALFTPPSRRLSLIITQNHVLLFFSHSRFSLSLDPLSLFPFLLEIA